MLASLRAHSNRHSLAFNLSKGALNRLEKSPCTFCTAKTLTAKMTYQNVGTRKFHTGFIDSNVFPLCKMCYRTRYGMSKSAYIRHAAKITAHMSTLVCKTYRRQNCAPHKVCIPRHAICSLCGQYSKATLDRIDSNGCYGHSNTQLLCLTCNRMKSNIVQTRFVSHMKHLGGF